MQLSPSDLHAKAFKDVISKLLSLVKYKNEASKIPPKAITGRKGLNKRKEIQVCQLAFLLPIQGIHDSSRYIRLYMAPVAFMTEDTCNIKSNNTDLLSNQTTDL